MAEEQAISEYSMTATQQSKFEQQNHESIAKWYWVALLLIFFGFYFLVFGIIELVTNYAQHRFQVQFTCSSYRCTGQLNSMGFPNQSTIYLYLYNNHFTQNVIEGININQQEIIKNCESFSSNSEVNKNISMTGVLLQSQDKAYPCGQIPKYYPQTALTIRNIDTNQYINIQIDSLSLTQYSFANENLATQWANVQSPRYSVWSEKHIALGLYKYWGYTTDKMSGNFQIVMNSNNLLETALTEGLKIQFTDNQAMSGFNISLTVLNFIWALLMFFLACLSFYVLSKEKNINNNIDIKLETNKESIPQFSYSINQ